MVDQFEVTGLTSTVGAENVYTSDEWPGATVTKAHDEALDWVRAHRASD